MIEKLEHLFTEKEARWVAALVISLIAVILVRILRFVLNRYIRRSTADMSSDPTRYNFLKNSVSALVFLFAGALIIYIFPNTRSLAISLLAGAGIFAAFLGFASQQAFSNIVGGIFLVIFKPFRVNDQIKVGDKFMGVVEDITLRHTVIRDFEQRRIIIPNSVMSSESIINFHIVDPKLRRHIEIDISYDSSIDKAKEIMEDVVSNHPFCIDNRSEEDLAEGQNKVLIRVVNFAESGITLRAWAWASSPDEAFVMHCDVREALKKRFDQGGIEIPFPHRTLVMKENKTAPFT